MDNKKIGKLIADLRKKKGLTQQDLGDMVGVGFRAVSKWECGMTLPDITIINELSKILGISLDELMSGEINEETKNTNKKKISPSIKKILIVCVLAITILISFLIYYNNKTYTYKIVSDEKSDYYVEGKIHINNNTTSLIINKLYFKDIEFSNTVITNYEYSINLKDNILMGYGYIEFIELLEQPIKIKEFAEKFTINYDVVITLNKKEIINNIMSISFKFLDNHGNEIEKQINATFEKID